MLAEVLESHRDGIAGHRIEEWQRGSNLVVVLGKNIKTQLARNALLFQEGLGERPAHRNMWMSVKETNLTREPAGSSEIVLVQPREELPPRFIHDSVSCRHEALIADIA